MTHTTLDAPENIDTGATPSHGERTGGATAFVGFFWGLVDAAQFAFTMLSILAGLAFVLLLIL